MGDFEERLKEQELEQGESDLEISKISKKGKPQISDPRVGPVVPSVLADVPEPLSPEDGPQKGALNKNLLKQLVVVSGVIMVILIIVVLGFKLGFFGSNRVSEKQLIVGASFSMEQNKSVKVEVGEENHEIEVQSIGEDWAEIVIRSEPIKVRLNVNQVIEVDIDEDGMSDLRIKLFKIENGRAIVAVKRIDKEACIEDWACGDWERCIGDKRERPCTDNNKCKSEFYKPISEQKCVGNAPIEMPSDNIILRDNGAGADEISNKTKLINIKANQTETNNVQTNITNNLNNTNITLASSCGNNQYACYESKGYFCKNSLSLLDVEFVCCVSPCVKFQSQAQFCDIMGRRLFSENETHKCIDQSGMPFNGTSISCCQSIVKKVTNEMLDEEFYHQCNDPNYIKNTGFNFSNYTTLDRERIINKEDNETGKKAIELVETVDLSGIERANISPMDQQYLMCARLVNLTKIRIVIDEQSDTLLSSGYVGIQNTLDSTTYNF